MKKSVILIIPFFLLMACTSIKKTISSVKTPEIENLSSISNYLRQNELSSYSVYTIKDLESWNKVLSYTRIPNLFFFTTEGVFLNPENDKSCLNDVTSFLENIENIETQSTDKDLNYFIDHSRTLSGEKFQLSTNKKYYAVFLWAKFGGKNMIKKMKYWEKILRDSEESFEIILLNFDEQQFWHSQESDN